MTWGYFAYTTTTPVDKDEDDRQDTWTL